MKKETPFDAAYPFAIFIIDESACLTGTNFMMNLQVEINNCGRDAWALSFIQFMIVFRLLFFGTL